MGEAGVSESGRKREGSRGAGTCARCGAARRAAAGGTIVEATAGNTGVGLALIGVNRGYKVMLYVPERFAEEKCMLMRGLGATVVRTPEAEGMAGAIRQALEFEMETPGAFAVLQFENPANPDFHEETTAVEIWEQMDGRVDAWISGVGSAGTFTGVARFLKKKRPEILTVAVEPQGSVLQGGEPGPHKVEGIGVSFIPATFDRSVCDRVMKVMDEPAFAMVKRLAVGGGCLCGVERGGDGLCGGGCGEGAGRGEESGDGDSGFGGAVSVEGIVGLNCAMKKAEASTKCGFAQLGMTLDDQIGFG